MTNETNPILTHLDRGTLARREWGDGYERACLLAALAPETAARESASACPASVMPLWLAHLTPRMDDYGTDDAWEPMVRRYAALLMRWHVLDDAAWERARIASLIVIVEEARSHVADETRWGVRDAVDGVLGWLRRGAPESEREGVLRAAYAAADAAAAVAAVYAAAAYAAAYAAADAAALAAPAAANAAANARQRSAYARQRSAYARQHAWDRMTGGILDAIEAEIVAAEVDR